MELRTKRPQIRTHVFSLSPYHFLRKKRRERNWREKTNTLLAGLENPKTQEKLDARWLHVRVPSPASSKASEQV